MVAKNETKLVLSKEKDTKRYTKYNFEHPFTGSLYLPFNRDGSNTNPATVEVTLVVPNGQ